MSYKSMTKEERLSKGNLNQLMFAMAVPTIIAQVINILYNIVDRIYIGHIQGVGSTALTGVGIALPILTLFNSSTIITMSWIISITIK